VQKSKDEPPSFPKRAVLLFLPFSRSRWDRPEQW
jgi:hypothetical protein